MLEFQGSTIIFTIIDLVVLYLFLRKFLFGRVNEILEKRASLITEQMDSAQENDRRAQELKEEYEGKLTRAHQDAAKIVAEAQDRGQRAYEAKLAEAEDDVRRVHAEARAQIDEERQVMLRGAKNEVASLALLAAAKVAQKSMDAADDKALVDSFLTEVGEGA